MVFDLRVFSSWQADLVRLCEVFDVFDKLHKSDQVRVLRDLEIALVAEPIEPHREQLKLFTEAVLDS